MNDKQRQELDELTDQNGGMLKTKVLIEFAKDKKTACHNAFTWNLREAAEKQWHTEAMSLIRAHIIYNAMVARPTRALISVPSDRVAGEGYRRINDVLANPMLVDQMVDEVRKRIRSLSTSYCYLRFLDGLWPRLELQMEQFIADSKNNGNAA